MLYGYTLEQGRYLCNMSRFLVCYWYSSLQYQVDVHTQVHRQFLCTLTSFLYSEPNQALNSRCKSQIKPAVFTTIHTQFLTFLWHLCNRCILGAFTSYSFLLASYTLQLPLLARLPALQVIQTVIFSLFVLFYCKRPTFCTSPTLQIGAILDLDPLYAKLEISMHQMFKAC